MLKSSTAGKVEIGMQCEGDDCAGYDTLPAEIANANEWTEIRLSLSCLTAMDMKAVTSPFSLKVDGAGTVAVTDVHFTEDEDAQETCLSE